MRLFESTWRDGFKFYERYFCTIQNQSVKKRIDLPYEWYEPQSKGLYTSILDESIKLEKKQGNSKSANGNYGVLDPMYRNIRDNYWGSNTSNSYNLEPRIFYLDIETRSGVNSKGFPVPNKALEEITLIQIYDNKEKTMIVLGLREWVHESDYSFDFPVKYIKCTDEIHLLETYFSIFKKLDPLIIYAWNGEGFDFPYIFNRLKNLGMDANLMSNYGDCSLKESEFHGKTDYKLNAVGHYYIDMLPVYKKFTFKPRPNYSLDTIAEIELKENKVQHNEYAAFDDFYTGKYIIPEEPTSEQKNSKIYKAAIKGDWDEVKELAHSEFVYYGCIDTYLIRRIDEKRNFSVLLNMISEKMGVTIGDATGTVKPWAQYIANKSMLNMKVMPPKKEYPQPSVVGGFVREVDKGKHEWILSADVNSMYPLLGMVGFNMSPETFVPKYKLPSELRDIVLSYFNDQEELNRFNISPDIWFKTTELLKEHNLSLGINGAVFDSKKIGTIPEMVQEIYDTRKIAKGKQFKYEQRKVLIGEIIKGKTIEK